MAERMTGSSSRKASWPLSLSISTKLTRAPAAFSARTIERPSGVGLKPVGGKAEHAEKRTSRALRKASANRPS